MNKDLKSKYFTKETIIMGAAGLVVGIAATCIVGACMNFFAKSVGMARLKYGDTTVATVAGKAISTETLYNKARLSDGLRLLMGEVDSTILDSKYTLSEKEEQEAKEQADYYINYYKEQGYTEQEFLEGNGFANYDEFLNDIKTRTKSNKFLYDYLESKLEKGAVQKYYDEHKDEIETYDSEHILVKISDSVTDEQALALANEIIGKLNEGKTFDEVVEEYKDKITHENLGYQGKNASLEQSYIDELVALKDGEYSKTPIKTSYGYHIVHRLATATFDDLRGTIIEELSKDLLETDENLTYKAFVELRKENNLSIFDDNLKQKYEKYCENLEKANS